LFDVLALGGAATFGTVELGTPLRALLESPDVIKVTFDCRADSDALFHQFQVRLTGVLDLQVRPCDRERDCVHRR
jgi:exonuclease 3'-5' domain-containing protein 1